MTTPTRHASCRCGEIRIACTGEPIRVSVCHCRECKARSGSAFAVQVRTQGEPKMWQYTGDSGNTADFFFRPTCGSGAWYRAAPTPSRSAISNPATTSSPNIRPMRNARRLGFRFTDERIDHYD